MDSSFTKPVDLAADLERWESLVAPERSLIFEANRLYCAFVCLDLDNVDCRVENATV